MPSNDIKLKQPAKTMKAQEAVAQTADQEHNVNADLTAAETSSQRIAANAPTLAQSRRDELASTFDALQRMATKVAAAMSSSAATQNPTACVRAVDRIQVRQLNDIAATQLFAQQVARMIDDARASVADQRPKNADADHQSPQHQDLRQDRTTRQAADLAELAKAAEGVVQSRYQDMRNDQTEELTRSAAALNAINPQQRLGEIVKDQVAAARVQDRNDTRFTQFLSARIDSILNRLRSDETASLRHAIGPPGAALSGAAIQRLYDAGRAKAETDKQQAKWKVKGQLSEELNDDVQRAKIRADKSASDTYIAGHRITDGWGKRLTDGIVRRSLADGTHEIPEAFEVKAGKASARGLNREQDKDKSGEPRKVARDDLIDEQVRQNVQNGLLTQQSRNEEIARIVARTDQELKGRAEQAAEAMAEQTLNGQLEKTKERLHVQPVFVDGIEMRRPAEDLRPRTKITAVVPRDVASKQERAHLDHTQRDIDRAAADAVAHIAALLAQKRAEDKAWNHT